MQRKVIDCGKIPSDISCTLTIAGTTAEVLDAVAVGDVEPVLA